MVIASNGTVGSEIFSDRGCEQSEENHINGPVLGHLTYLFLIFCIALRSVGFWLLPIPAVFEQGLALSAHLGHFLFVEAGSLQWVIRLLNIARHWVISVCRHFSLSLVVPDGLEFIVADREHSDALATT